MEKNTKIFLQNNLKFKSSIRENVFFMGEKTIAKKKRLTSHVNSYLVNKILPLINRHLLRWPI